MLSVAFPPSVFALPTGGQVVAGSVATTVGGTQMTLNQASRTAIMNWQQFNIAPNEAVRILQSGAGAAMLARVTGGNPTELLGRLQADGKLFLINPNGILVGAGAVIDTGAFLASTLDVADADFLKGGALTFKGDSGAGIVNLGSITAREGNVLLFAHTVKNTGDIAAPMGTAGLGAGTEIFLASPDDASFTVKLNLPSTAEKTGVENSGTIAAAQAELKAAGGSIYDLAVNQSGLVRASGVEQRPDGRVILTADGGTVAVTGSVSAQKADGSGGEILVGGDFQGKNPLVANATRTYVGPAAMLDASATATTGNGGKVVVWADGITFFSGAIAARGGSLGGNGGNAEVSGKGSLSFNGTADLRAPNGVRGTLLLDPLDLTINAGAAGANPAGLVTVGTNSTWPFNADIFAQSITNGTVNALLGTGNLELQATNSLTVGAAVSSNAVNSLTLNSPIIAVNAGISMPNGTLQFMSSNSAAVSLDSAAGAPITANQVQITGNFAPVTLAGAVTTQTLLFDTITGTSLLAANAANSIAQVQFMPGSINLSGDVAVASSSAMSVFGQATTTAGTITLTSGGNLTMLAGSTLTAGGNVTLASTGGAFINQAGAGLLAGSGRKLIYSATTGNGFTDGGLGYTQVNSVSYPVDPQGAGNVTYIQTVARIPYTIAAPSLTTLAGAVPANVVVNTPALPSSGPQFTVIAIPVRVSTGNVWSDASTPSYVLQPVIVPAANTTLGDISAYYDIQLVPGSLKTTRPPVDLVTLKQGTTVSITPVVFDTQPDTAITILDNSTTTPLLNEEELKAKMEAKDSKVVVKFGTMDKYTLNTVVNELGADLLPYVKDVLGNADSMKNMPEAQRKILEDYRDGKITSAQLATMMSRDPNALAAMMPALGKAMMDAVASGKPLSDAQQTFAAHIAENVNKQRIMLASELQKQRLEFELAKAEVGHNNPWALKTLPDIAMSAQQAATEQAIAAAIGAGAGLGLGVGVAGVLNISAVAGAVLPFALASNLVTAGAATGVGIGTQVQGGASVAATSIGAGSAAGVIAVAVGAVVIGVVSAVMVAQEQKNISAYDAAMARAKTPVDAKLTGLNLKNSDTSKAEFFSAFLATMLQIN